VKESALLGSLGIEITGPHRDRHAGSLRKEGDPTSHQGCVQGDTSPGVTTVLYVDLLTLKKTLGGVLSVIFYDVTTIYFQAEPEDELRATGYSKDGKASHPKILLGCWSALANTRWSTGYSTVALMLPS